MNIFFQRKKMKKKRVYAVSEISDNYGVTTSQGKCLLYFMSTFSILTYILLSLIFELMLRKNKAFFLKYKFDPFKNRYNDDIDQYNKLNIDSKKTVFTERSTFTTLSRVIKQVNLNKCTVFELDSFTKYSIFKNLMMSVSMPRILILDG